VQQVRLRQSGDGLVCRRTRVGARNEHAPVQWRGGIREIFD
jgi:hypothetical protein